MADKANQAAEAEILGDQGQSGGSAARRSGPRDLVRRSSMCDGTGPSPHIPHHVLGVWRWEIDTRVRAHDHPLNVAVQWIRARAWVLASRRLGSSAARQLAAQPSLESAVLELSMSPYGHGVRVGQSLEEAQHAVAETLLWNLRVLAGWLPGAGADLLRVLVGWFEIANVDEHLQALEAGEQGPYFVLGGLATAWPRLADTTNLSQVRRVMATSRWGDPGDDTASSIRLRFRTSWADRVYAKAPSARPWVAAAAALLAARVIFLEQRTLPPSAAVALGGVMPGSAFSAPDLMGSIDYASFVARLAPRSRELLLGAVPARGAADREVVAGDTFRDPDSRSQPDATALWRSEARWWSIVEKDAFALLALSGFGAEPIVGVAGVLAADAWRVRAALAAAAHGALGLETFDALG